MPQKRFFLDFFSDPSPALNVKFSFSEEEKPTTVRLKNKIGQKADKHGIRQLEIFCKNEKLQDFFEFYSTHDGLELFTPISPENCQKETMIKFIKSKYLQSFTNEYVEGGKHAWTINYNKSKQIYRGGDPWLAFAELGTGILTIFLEGENAGCVFFVTVEPHFNILKPIAKSFTLLLERIAKDPTAFTKLIKGYITIRKSDNQNYGYSPVEYIENCGGEVILDEDHKRSPFRFIKDIFKF
jgi:hypothetical protein